MVKAALTTASQDFDDEEDLQFPSTALKMGYDLKRMAGARWAMCLKSGDRQEIENCNDFLKLMQLEWSKLQKSHCNTSNQKIQFREVPAQSR